MHTKIDTRYADVSLRFFIPSVDPDSCVYEVSTGLTGASLIPSIGDHISFENEMDVYEVVHREVSYDQDLVLVDVDLDEVVLPHE